jgi:oligosaccharide repeat unit polymerase
MRFFWKNIDRHAPILYLFGSMFLFLLGRIFITLLSSEEYLPFSDETATHLIFSIFLSIVSMIAVYLLCQRESLLFERRQLLVCKSLEEWNKTSADLKKWLGLLFLATYPINIIIIIEKALFVRKFGYVALYANFVSTMPLIMVKIADLNIFIIAFYLSTFPTRKECRFIIILFILESILTLTTGVRNEFLLNMILLIVYFHLRNHINHIINQHETWIKRRFYAYLLLLTVLCIPFFVSIESIRSKDHSDMKGRTESYKSFLLEQGRTGYLIGYAKDLQNRIPNTNYSLNAFIKWYNQSYIANLFGRRTVETREVFSLEETRNFNWVMAYFSIGKKFFSGAGVGSNYIAEIYHDFGYAGIIILSCLYGLILGSFGKMMTRYPKYGAFFLLLIRNIIFVPRSASFEFLTNAFSISNIITYLVLYNLFKGKVRRSVYKDNVKNLHCLSGTD